jgi:hypothetical protein
MDSSPPLQVVAVMRRVRLALLDIIISIRINIHYTPHITPPQPSLSHTITPPQPNLSHTITPPQPSLSHTITSARWVPLNNRF